jgi:hypothetical protein
MVLTLELVNQGWAVSLELRVVDEGRGLEVLMMTVVVTELPTSETAMHGGVDPEVGLVGDFETGRRGRDVPRITPAETPARVLEALPRTAAPVGVLRSPSRGQLD